jgi:hypothetical protein
MTLLSRLTRQARDTARNNAKKLVRILLTPALRLVVRYPALKKRAIRLIDCFPGVASRLRRLFSPFENAASSDIISTLGPLPPHAAQIYSHFKSALAEKRRIRSDAHRY